MKRRKFIRNSGLATAGLFIHRTGFSDSGAAFPVVRVPEKTRKFRSASVEKIIIEIQQKTGNRELGWLFGNSFPNTLDTTVDYSISNGMPDTYVITGDIDAMWLRDSSAQVWPYLPFCHEDKQLQLLIQGVIHRQAVCILKDPYANAFYKDENKISEWKATDETDMQPGIHERKWEIDSLCYPIRLAHGYWKATDDTTPFNARWADAMRNIIKTFTEQQRKSGHGPYHFQRKTSWATDGVPMAGYGYPARPNGLICSMFRPSDDATIFPYLIPSNLFAASSLHQLGELAGEMQKKNPAPGWQDMITAADALETELLTVLQSCIVDRPGVGKMFPYEMDGFGNATFMDDANVPSLLSLSYLLDPAIIAYAGFAEAITNSRRMVLSSANPFFFSGKAGEGIGGPHAGIDMIWPLSIIMRALTSIDDKEIRHCLEMLQKSHAGTGFMHESFNKDDASKFTRKWFAWANTLFGELVLKIYREQPQLLA